MDVVAVPVLAVLREIHRMKNDLCRSQRKALRSSPPWEGWKVPWGFQGVCTAFLFQGMGHVVGFEDLSFKVLIYPHEGWWSFTLTPALIPDQVTLCLEFPQWVNCTYHNICVPQLPLAYCT